MTKLNSFDYIAQPDARLLILGSMPGIKSLNAQEYYAHPHNAFWRIMSRLFNFKPDLPYPEKCLELCKQHIALWDVMKHCQREGSLDSAIVEDSIEVNDFDHFLTVHPDIQHIFFNGQKAEKSFKRYAQPLAKKGIKLRTLPSTSPAYASMRFEEKLDNWRQALCA